MKLAFVLIICLFASSAFAGMNCIGTTVTYDNQGDSTKTETLLTVVEGEGDHAVYYGESDVFKFWAEHAGEKISMTILDKKDWIVVNNPGMQVSRFLVSIAAPWKNRYFANLSCKPVR